jgi:hypothetical protein
LRWYGIDLLDLWRGRLTWRRAGILLANLPPGSAVSRAKGSNTAWTEAEHLLAGITDVLLTANWQRAGAKGARPKPLMRPADVKAAAETKDRIPQRAMAFLRRQRARAARNEAAPTTTREEGTDGR